MRLFGVQGALSRKNKPTLYNRWNLLEWFCWVDSSTPAEKGIKTIPSDRQAEALLPGGHRAASCLPNAQYVHSRESTGANLIKRVNGSRDFTRDRSSRRPAKARDLLDLIWRADNECSSGSFVKIARTAQHEPNKTHTSMGWFQAVPFQHSSWLKVS